jgi:hypothetical protein
MFSRIEKVILTVKVNDISRRIQTKLHNNTLKVAVLSVPTISKTNTTRWSAVITL